MIGERIAERRKELGWTPYELARRAGLDVARIYEFERGDKTDCTVSTARRIARALGCGMDYLVETWNMSVDPPPPLTPPPPRRPRGRPRKRPAEAAASR